MLTTLPERFVETSGSSKFQKKAKERERDAWAPAGGVHRSAEGHLRLAEDLAAATPRHGGRHPLKTKKSLFYRVNRFGTVFAHVPASKEAHMESSTSKTTNRFGTWIESLVARMRASAWTPLAAKAAAGLGGFLALAFVGSGAAADLLPGRAGTYLGPPTISSAPAPSALPAASAASTPGQTPVVADAGAPEADAASPPPPTTSAITADGKVILNLATEDDLRKLPGIGPKKAQAIIALRTKLKKFTRPEDLLRVKGIGRKKLAKLRPHLLIDPPDKP